jgi:hypothetical protein
MAHLRVWSNGMTRAFHALDVGSIPTIRFNINQRKEVSP